MEQPQRRAPRSQNAHICSAVPFSQYRHELSILLNSKYVMVSYRGNMKLENPILSTQYTGICTLTLRARSLGELRDRSAELVDLGVERLDGRGLLLAGLLVRAQLRVAPALVLSLLVGLVVSASTTPRLRVQHDCFMKN